MGAEGGGEWAMGMGRELHRQAAITGRSTKRCRSSGVVPRLLAGRSAAAPTFRTGWSRKTHSFPGVLTPYDIPRARWEIGHRTRILDRGVAPLGLRQVFQELSRQRILHLCTDIGELFAAGLDGVATNEVDAEGRPHRLAHLSNFEGESGPRECFVHGTMPSDVAQVATLLAARRGGVLLGGVGKGDFSGDDLTANVLSLFGQRVGGCWRRTAPQASGGSD